MGTVKSIMVGAGAALFLAVAALIFGLFLANAHLKAELAAAQADGAALRSGNAAFKDAVEKQNKAVLALQAAGRARTAVAAQAAKKAQAEAVRYAKLADQIRKQKTSGDDCAAAREVLRKFLRYRKKADGP